MVACLKGVDVQDALYCKRIEPRQLHQVRCLKEECVTVRKSLSPKAHGFCFSLDVGVSVVSLVKREDERKNTSVGVVRNLLGNNALIAWRPFGCIRVHPRKSMSLGAPYANKGEGDAGIGRFEPGPSLECWGTNPPPPGNGWLGPQIYYCSF